MTYADQYAIVLKTRKVVSTSLAKPTTIKSAINYCWLALETIQDKNLRCEIHRFENELRHKWRSIKNGIKA